jgi:hypothetical protein
LGGDLWRLAPARDVWEQFTPPVPPDAARIGYTIDLAIDPDGNPWPRVSLCGGASCDTGALRYRFSDGRWTPIGEITDAYRRETILFQPPVAWLFELGEPWNDNMVRVLTGQDVMLDLAEGFDVYAATIDADGRVWVVGKLPDPRQPMAIWIALEG